MNYVKTYELFGLSKREQIAKKLALQKAMDDRTKSDREEKEKKAKDANAQFIKNIKEFLTNEFRSERVESIEVDIDNEKEEIGAKIKLNRKEFDGVAFKGIHLPINEAFIILKFYLDVTGLEVTSYPKLVIETKDIANSKGELSNKVINIDIPMYERIKRYTMSGRDIVVKRPTDLDFNFNKLDDYIEKKITKVKYWIERYIESKIAELAKKEELEKFSKISEDEVKDIVSDILDMSNGIYLIDKGKDSYVIFLNISGLSRHSESGIKITKETNQVMRYLPEIRDRLEDIGLEISANFKNFDHKGHKYNLVLVLRAIKENITR